MASPASSDIATLEDPEDTVPLTEILTVRDECLRELELWALCRECCLLLEYVQDSREMFQAVSITPETVGFDAQGNLCFLYLDSTDPEPLFLPPEIDDGSDKQIEAHLYSLGMTMLYAAEYNVQAGSTRERGKMSGELSRLVGRMTADNPHDRPAADVILTNCDKMLAGESSQEICADLAAICQMKSPQQEDGAPAIPNGPTLAEINSQLEQGHVNGVPLHLWNNHEGHSLDSDSELADVFSKSCKNNNNNTNKVLTDPNLTQDGILYSASTEPSHVGDVTWKHEGGSEIGSSDSTCITDLLNQYTSDSNKLIGPKVSTSPTVSDSAHLSDTPGRGSDSKPGSNSFTDTSYNAANLNYQLKGYHSKGLLVLEDDSLMSDSFDLNGSEYYLCDQYDMENSRKMSQSQLTKLKAFRQFRQGVTLGEVLEKKDGYLQEAELWAVCREAIKSLQKLKKRLPAYISPDTLILREEGFVSYKAIPEDKPLEVMYMAPELQQKGLLSQKTCLYGLAITLRCASGKKFSLSPNPSLSVEMDSLLQAMLHKDLDKRPPLTEVLAMCDDHEQLSDVPSSAICQFMFQDTATAMMESEAELEMSIGSLQTRAAQQQAELMQHIRPSDVRKTHKKPAEGSKSDTKRNDSNGGSGGISTTPQETAGTSFSTTNGGKTSAFVPVTGSLSNPPVKEIKRVPSKYSSTTTHFTPIVLHHSPAGENPAGRTKSEGSKVSSDSDSKETDVVKKLKELKEHLMKRRNSEEKAKEGNSKESPAATSQNSPNIVKNSEVSSGKKTSVDKTPSSEKSASSEKNASSEKTPSQVSLETIAHLLQNQGQLAQLNMLAATIAQLLQSAGYNNNNKITQSPQNSPNTEAQVRGHVPLTANMRLPSLDVPQQFQDQYVGQTVTMPVQTTSGAVTNYPVQLQLQHDPSTGLIQLVPVGLIGTPVNSRGSDVESVASPSRSSSGVGKPVGSGRYSSASGSSHARHSDHDGFQSLGRPPRSKGRGPRSRGHSRNATPNSAAREGGNLRKAQSEHNLAHIGSPDHLVQNYHGLHQNGLLTGSIPNLVHHNSAGTYILPVYDDSLVYNTWHAGKQMNGKHCGTNNANRLVSHSSEQRTRGTRHMSPTDSQSSSPSPSKDSGVSGVNSGGGVNGGPAYPYPPTDVTLMERLLGHDSIQQQQTLQAVVGLLRGAFSDNSCLEVDGEDYIMGEYISSLAGLKWETFRCAIEEKYPDLLWDEDVLQHLHSTVNNKTWAAQWSNQPANEGSGSQDGLDISGDPVVASTPRQEPSGLKPQLSVTQSEGKISVSSVETSHSGDVKSDTAIREPCYRYSPTPRGGLHRFNPSRNLYSQGGDTCTSDSTDTSENIDRKRRYKKRHQLNRSKNSSLQSSPRTPQDHSLSTQGSGQSECNQDVADTDVMQVNHRKSGELTPVHSSRHGSVNSSVRSQNSPLLPRLSEKSSSEDVSRMQNGSEDKDFEVPALYSLAGDTIGEEDSSIHFTSTPFNMAQQAKTVCIDRDGSFNNGSVVKHLSYEYENSAFEEGDVFSETPSNGHQTNSVSSSGSVHSSLKQEEHVALNGDNSSQNKSSGSSSRSDRGADYVQRNRGNVVYHSAELQYCMTPQLEHVIQELEPKNEGSLLKKKAQLDQQVMMERRTKKKMQQFYKKLIDGRKPAKGDHKSMLTQVSKDIKDMTSRLKFMELAWGHVEMLLSELNGISPSLLHSLAVQHLGDPLSLSPSSDNPLLQFQLHHDTVLRIDVRVLQAGTPDGLMAYLFTLSALADGFVHQFLYTFRYFVSQQELFEFITSKYMAAKRNPSDSLNERVMVRAADLLYYWLEGYYTVDFERDAELLDKLQEFIINEVTYPDGFGAMLLGLLQDCNHGNNTELSFTGAVITDDIDLQMRQDDSFSPKKLSGFKAMMKSSPMKSTNPAIISSSGLDIRMPINGYDEGYAPRTSRRFDAFTLADHTAQTVAEQLCLMQQTLFQKVHPVNYLNTKAQGIGVAMAVPGVAMSNNNRSRGGVDVSELTDPGLFEGAFYPNPGLTRMIKAGQEIAHWVAAEIVSCSSIKSQLSMLTKFIHTAQLCMQMRNFASCVAISDGLENLIVRQLPVWKNLPTKYISIKEEMASVKMLLKNEPLCLVEDREFRDHPTIPSILLFIMHVQQREIGGFTLANGMFKWPKLRSLAQTIDQLRMFKEQQYQFEVDEDLQDILRHRIHELSCQDLQELASQHDTNYHKVSSRGIFSRMKGKLQYKGDKS